MKMKSFITLFIVGIIGGVFCELTAEQKSIISCIQDTMAEFEPGEFKLLKKLSPENFLKVSSERFTYENLEDLSLKPRTDHALFSPEVMLRIKKKCKGQETLISDLVQKGEKLVNDDKAYKRYKIYLEDETLSGFIRLMFGLLVDTNNTHVVSELFERQFASAILAERLIPEDNHDYYRRRYYASLFAYLTGFEGISIVTTQLSGCDPRTELIQKYCQNFTSDSNTDEGSLQIWKWFSDRIDKFRLFDPHKVYDKYVKKGKNKLSTNNNTNEETLFIAGVCNTSDWADFKSLIDETDKYDRIECILMNTDEFFNNVAELLNLKRIIPFQSTCVTQQTFSIEEITDVGMKFLKDFDKSFFRLFLHTRNKIKTLNNNSEYEIEEKIKDEEDKIEGKRKGFIALHKKYKISLKWTCMSKNEEDVPFNGWLETLSVLYRPPKRIENYLDEFKDDTADYFKTIEDQENNMHAKILDIRSVYKKKKDVKKDELNKNLEKGKITEFRKILEDVEDAKLNELIGKIKREFDELANSENADFNKLIEKTKNEIDKLRPAKNDNLDKLIEKIIEKLNNLQNPNKNAELHKLLEQTNAEIYKLEDEERDEIKKVVENANNVKNAMIDELYQKISEKIKKNKEEKDLK